MSNYRKERINDAVSQELAIALRSARDPVLAASFVSVTRAEVAADLKIAKIFVSFLQGEEKEVLNALKRASGMLRRHLAATLNLRITPELLFVSDRSLAHGAHIASLLHQIEEDDKRIAEERKKAGGEESNE
ncbi:MAG: 30S ribosome-binding factor RbfA [Clostridia bacterium]|nr:30S ribosome-binding factor RbfA [Clostridia bacterium]